METNSKSCYCLNGNSNDEFIRWVVELLGPVLLGVKPSEIMSFPGKDRVSIRRKEEVKAIINRSSKVNFAEFDINNGCSKIFFYNLESLDYTLREFVNLKFLKTLHYPQEYEIHTYLDYIVEKMKRGETPHEIGVFLGYPLKDVIGFIGHPSLRLTKTNGWRVYGDPRLSDEKHRKIQDAKKQIKNMLQTRGLQEIIQSA
ncbi:Protein of unknown function [Anaerovirgula multivorans]|uniref:DUF3793 family protein n=1 Tax=Anaerovirgula multivorans TaxID=312168 RepID=A0A239CFC7_9FIRM|nr:DUF3793 family protein [Anaerovirgula multivorans]SNS18935.1 Protein of unknown function [Anaerovirgula multivorans]